MKVNKNKRKTKLPMGLKEPAIADEKVLSSHLKVPPPLI
jgi:hypothetical protein